MLANLTINKTLRNGALEGKCLDEGKVSGGRLGGDQHYLSGAAPERRRGQEDRLGKGTPEGPIHNKALVKSLMVITCWFPHKTYQSYSSLYPQHPVPHRCSISVC